MGDWDDMIAQRQADLEYYRDFIARAEAGEVIHRHRDGDREWDALPADLDRARKQLADAEAQVARLREKNR